MATELYHKDVYKPEEVFAAPEPMRVRYTQHAKEAAKHDRYGDLTSYLRNWVDVIEEEVVEVEVKDGRIVKRVIRQQVTSELDLVMVITAENVVKTVWGNLHTDQHETLVKSKFVTGPSLH